MRIQDKLSNLWRKWVQHKNGGSGGIGNGQAGLLGVPKPGHSLLSRLSAQPAAQILFGGLADISFLFASGFLLTISPFAIRFPFSPHLLSCPSVRGERDPQTGLLFLPSLTDESSAEAWKRSDPFHRIRTSLHSDLEPLYIENQNLNIEFE